MFVVLWIQLQRRGFNSDHHFHSSFIDFQVWDFPGQMDFFDPTFDTTAIFGEVGALVFVIDSQVKRTGGVRAKFLK